RHEVLLENYIKKVQIEARILGDLASTYILPASIKYQNVVLENIRGLKDLGFEEETYSLQKQIVTKISEHIAHVSSRVTSMIEARKLANVLENPRDKAIAYCDTVKTYFDEIRYHVDKLELLVDDEYWELPKYREILFLR
ncbi:MAG: glutamine synthetase type III, partial [Ginsengibacter sp.]